MKIIKQVSMIIIFSIFFCTNLQSDDLMNQAHKFFHEKIYDKALGCYKKIEPKDAVIWYNIGLCYMNLKDSLQTRIAFARAEKYGRWDIWKKLDDVRFFMHVEQDPNFVEKWSDQLALFCKRCILSIPMIALQLWLYIMVLIFFGMYRYQVGATYKNYCMMFFIILATLYAIFFKDHKASCHTGIIIHDNTEVYAGPDSSFCKKDIIDLGKMISWHKDSMHGYYQILYDNKYGWVHKKNIEIL